MRVNVYAEELTDGVQLITKTADTGVTFIGIRFVLKSPSDLHHSEKDDDSSGVTFWVKSSKAGYKPNDEQTLKYLFARALGLLQMAAEKA